MLSAYLERVEYDGAVQPDYATLAALHLAHATHIPFENIDVLLRRPIRLDLDSLQAKLIGARRGGYCFEQNLLFAAVLEEIGFRVTRLAARVRYRAPSLQPRAHMLLLVEADAAHWVADVGYGGEGLLLPIPFEPAGESRQFLWTYRVAPDGDAWAVQSLRDGAWIDLYAFTLEPQELVDYEMASHYVASHPESRLARTLTVQLPSPTVRHIVRNLELVVDRGESVESRSIGDAARLATLLGETFGLRFPGPDGRSQAAALASELFARITPA